MSAEVCYDGIDENDFETCLATSLSVVIIWEGTDME